MNFFSLTFCGITMRNYVEENINNESKLVLKSSIKMLANVSDGIVFVLLGVSTVTEEHQWDTWFVLLTVVFCFIYRLIG